MKTKITTIRFNVKNKIYLKALREQNKSSQKISKKKEKNQEILQTKNKSNQKSYGICRCSKEDLAFLWSPSRIVEVNSQLLTRITIITSARGTGRRHAKFASMHKLNAIKNTTTRKPDFFQIRFVIIVHIFRNKTIKLSQYLVGSSISRFMSIQRLAFQNSIFPNEYKLTRIFLSFFEPK